MTVIGWEKGKQARPRADATNSFSVSGIVRRIAGTVLIGMTLLLISACNQSLPTYRYRLTVEVDTPEGLKTGSSVIEVRAHKGGGFPGPEAGGVRGAVRGEAVAVNLGRRGILFALLRGAEGSFTGADGYAWALLPKLPTRSSDIAALRENRRALMAVEGSADLHPQNYPWLVRFRDTNDPMTVEQVNPASLQSTFGTGVRLRRIRVEMTDDSPSAGRIEEMLPWLDSMRGPLDGASVMSANGGLSNKIGSGDFRLD